MKPLQPLSVLPTPVTATLHDDNPWWRGERLFGLPSLRRWAFDAVLSGVQRGLTPATVLRGPRQVGKTTLLNQVIDILLAQGVAGRRIFRVQFDELPALRNVTEPILELARWYAATVLQKSFNQSAHDGEQAYLFFDEIQNLPDWAPQLKHLVDMHPVRVLVTGSSALRIEAGRDSLAGRVSTIDMGPLLLREIAQLRGFGTLKRCYLPTGWRHSSSSNSGRRYARLASARPKYASKLLPPLRSVGAIRWRRSMPTSPGKE